MPIAMVTGASRGVGRGVVLGLAAAGFEVFATGRSIETADLPASVIRIAWGGYERMVEEGKFTWSLPFWEQPAHRWSSMVDVGVRGAFVASAHAARMMTRNKRGHIVNISFWAARKYIGNSIYGISKAAMEKMTADMAHELRPHSVAAVSLYPGLVRTEAVMAAAEGGWLDISNR